MSAAPTITPHSKSQLDMSEKAGSWRDIKVHLWSSDHELAPDKPTLCVCFERRGEDGYVYTVVTPSGVRTLSMNAFYAYVKGHREEVDVGSEMRRRLYNAWLGGYESLRQALVTLQNTTAVTSGVHHG